MMWALFMTGTDILTHDLGMKQVQGGHSNTLFELKGFFFKLKKSEKQ